MEATCEALIGTTRLATDRLQSSVCCPRSTSPVPETSPRRVCMLNIWHEMWPATRRQSASSVSKGVRLSWLHPSPSSGAAVVSKRVKSTGTAPPCEFTLSVPDRPLMRPATFAPAVDSSVFTAATPVTGTPRPNGRRQVSTVTLVRFATRLALISGCDMSSLTRPDADPSQNSSSPTSPDTTPLFALMVKPPRPSLIDDAAISPAEIRKSASRYLSRAQSSSGPVPLSSPFAPSR